MNKTNKERKKHSKERKKEKERNKAKTIDGKNRHNK